MREEIPKMGELSDIWALQDGIKISGYPETIYANYVKDDTSNLNSFEKAKFYNIFTKLFVNLVTQNEQNQTHYFGLIMGQESDENKEFKSSLIDGIFDFCWFDGNEDETFDDDDVVT